MTMDITIDGLKAAKFRGPVAFYDGREGMARQDYECVDEPRFGYFWTRKNRRDKGRQAYMVDGAEVKDLDDACAKLALPADPDSPKEVRRREFDELRASPSLNRGATRALNDAECNASAGVFGQVRAFVNRADNGWHQGINAFADTERKESREWPHWLYDAKSAAHETYRGVYLFASDATADTGLKCALGTKCRDCPILRSIEEAMVSSRAREKFPSAIEDEDIVGAKVWTCISHILVSHSGAVHDGAFFTTTESRKGYF